MKKRQTILEKFEDFLADKHAKNYQGFDDDMPDDFSKWLEELQIDDIIKYANETLNEQREEFKEIVEKKLDALMANPGEEDQVALDNLCDILKEIEKL